MGPKKETERQKLANAVMIELASINRESILKKMGFYDDCNEVVISADGYVLARIMNRTLIAFEKLVNGELDFQSAMLGILKFHSEAIRGEALNAYNREKNRRRREQAYAAANPEVCESNDVDHLEDLLSTISLDLSDEEYQLLRWTISGMSTIDMAKRVDSSDATVRKRVSRMLSKLRKMNAIRKWFD